MDSELHIVIGNVHAVWARFCNRRETQFLMQHYRCNAASGKRCLRMLCIHKLVDTSDSKAEICYCAAVLHWYNDNFLSRLHVNTIQYNQNLHFAAYKVNRSAMPRKLFRPYKQSLSDNKLANVFSMQLLFNRLLIV